MPAAVPVRPAIVPVIVAAAVFCEICGARAVTNAPASTETPAARAIPRGDVTATIAVPASAPGIRPKLMGTTVDHRIAVRSFAMTINESGSPAMMNTPGTEVGKAIAPTGTAMRLSPRPTDPWTAEPTKMAMKTQTKANELMLMGRATYLARAMYTQRYGRAATWFVDSRSYV